MERGHPCPQSGLQARFPKRDGVCNPVAYVSCHGPNLPSPGGVAALNPRLIAGKPRGLFKEAPKYEGICT